LALGQTNPIVGDLAGNSQQILEAARLASAQGADILAVGEMALSGYPIEDLASRPSFLAEAHAAVDHLAKRLQDAGFGDLVVVVGHPDGPFEPRLIGTSSAPTAIAQNRASVLQHGHVKARYAKHHLPNYSVFDEYRIFIPGDELLVLRIKGADVAVIICEDLWRDGGPLGRVLEADAGLLLVINASPFERDKDDVRLPLVTRRALEADTTVAYVNIVGGQDDLVFDGDSVVVDGTGAILARAPQFREHLLVLDLDVAEATAASLPDYVVRVALETADSTGPAPLEDIAVPPDDREQLWNALVLGLRDYVAKNGFPSVILGLSGGIDSAVCAALGADAIGADRCRVIGWSGGGPHALACAAQMPDRVIGVATIGGVAPYPAEGLDWTAGMGAENIEEFAAALAGADELIGFKERNAPILRVVTPEEVADAFGDLIDDVDRGSLTGALSVWMADSLHEALRNGYWGWFDDDMAFTKPWGFELSEIRVPAFIWQGGHDRMVPYAHGEWLAAHIPGARPRLFAEEGHLSLAVEFISRVVDELLTAG
jgi:NAD+ synthase (glutamine-hydrolysing)